MSKHLEIKVDSDNITFIIMPDGSIIEKWFRGTIID